MGTSDPCQKIFSRRMMGVVKPEVQLGDHIIQIIFQDQVVEMKLQYMCINLKTDLLTDVENEGNGM